MTLLADIVATSQRILETSSRRTKTTEIAGCLRHLDPEEIEIGVAFLSGETRQGRSGIGYASLRKARSPDAAQIPTLSLRDVDEALSKLAATSGSGSAAARSHQLSALFARATTSEQDFLFRLLIGELRQGALQGLMFDGVALAANLPASDVRRAGMVAGGIAKVARAALTEGASGLQRFAMVVFQPIAPMLAQPADDIETALAELGGTVALEWKLDGARVQVHKSGDDVRIFTRNLNDVTVAAPEIVEAVRIAHAQELILDGETIALRAGGAPHPFQTTMRRFGRSLDVAALRESLPLAVFFFDCLQRDGHSLIGMRADERFRAMAEVLPPALLTPRLVTDDVSAAQAFYDEVVHLGHEGVMAKSLSAPYDPGSRSASWLKMKRVHTLDLVVLAAEWGHGRRHGWLSNLHLGARDPVSGGHVMLGKTFKGMTDALLAWQTEELLKRALDRDQWTVYVRPELVVEITFNDLQESPRYPGGLALRFARVKGYRPDKRPEEADTIDTVRAIYSKQLQRQAATEIA
jgi:DNA ligase-1